MFAVKPAVIWSRAKFYLGIIPSGPRNATLGLREIAVAINDSLGCSGIVKKASWSATGGRLVAGS